MITDTQYKKHAEFPYRPAVGQSEDSVGFNQLVHDLKSPVNSLKGILQLANVQVEDEQAKEFFFMINECINKLENKISNTLTMYEKGHGLAEVEHVDFQLLLYEMMISLGHIEGFEKISFSTDINNATPFYSSRPLVESILQNLIENAIKYRHEDKGLCSVRISIHDVENGIRLRVIDNGIGIDKSHLPYIFEANFKSVMNQKDSHGLGLFIVKRTVEKLNGKINVSSTLGVGTAFTIDLPNVC